MAVFEHTYRKYAGPLTAPWSRFLIIPRDAFGDVFGSKLFTAFFVSCFAAPLVFAILIYLHHNLTALAMFDLDASQLVPIDMYFFHNFVVIQGTFAFFLNVFVGPSLVSRDLANNALPLYLCRPFSRVEYVLGKMSVVLILLSAITWVPGLLLFALQSYLEGAGWFARNLLIFYAILLGSWVWILVLALLSQAVSAWVKWKMAAKAALLGLFFVPAAMGQAINNLFDTEWGGIISLRAVISTVWATLFVDPESIEVPVWGAFASLLVVCAICLFLLMRKIQAYEVIR
jgi:ABC-2 type transport system permease protein